MPTFYDFAKIADNAYNPKKNAAVRGTGNTHWTCIDVGETGYGFRGGIYSSIPLRTTVVAFKGTQGIKDLGADVELAALNRVPQQIGPAKKLVELALKRGAARSDLVLTGHSLGGALAQVIGYNNELPFVTFNAPPMGTNVMSPWAKTARLLGLALGASGGISGAVIGGVIANKVSQFLQGEIPFPKGVNVRVEWDFVSSSWWGGTHVGQIKTIPQPFAFNPYERHSLVTLSGMLSPQGSEAALGSQYPFDH